MPALRLKEDVDGEKEAQHRLGGTSEHEDRAQREKLRKKERVNKNNKIGVGFAGKPRKKGVEKEFEMREEKT